MNPFLSVRRRWLAAMLGLGLAMLAATPAQAHDTRLGDLRIDHAYALPTAPGVTVGAVYFRALSNRGAAADRLLGARTSVAEAVEIHRSQRDGEVLRMREVPAIELPPGAELKPRHGGDTHLMLRGLKAPLREGERFALRLRFEKAGEAEVTVWVQRPRSREEREGRERPEAEAHDHRH